LTGAAPKNEPDNGHGPTAVRPSDRRCTATAITLLTCIGLGAADVAGAQGRVVPVTTAEARRTTVEDTDWAVGVLESRLSPQVAAEVSGRVVRVLVDEGQGVEAGQPLAEVETQQYRLGLQADEAEVGRLSALLKNKQQELDRAHRLVAEKLIAAEQVDAIESELQALHEQLEGARAKSGESQRRLGETRLVAPVRSEIAVRHVDEGDYVQTGTVAFDLIDVEHLRVKLPFPEYRAPQLRPGLKVRLSSAAAGNQVVESTITEIRPSVNPANRSLTIIVDFDNPGQWRPGASVRAELVLAVREDAVMVPQVAVVRRPAGDVVYVIREGKAEERLVQRGQRNGDRIEIVDGLAAGERVAVDGAGFLTQGASVDVSGEG
jgi:RND family efflux transporter MFP subunit